MLLPRFEYLEPTSLDQAAAALAEKPGQASVLAGGTDLLVNLKRGLVKPDRLVGLTKIDGLAQAEASGEGLTIGPLVTTAELAAQFDGSPKYGALAQAAGKLGTPLIRNRATVAGNILSARPAADMSPPLLALGAQAVLQGPKGQRQVALDGFFTGPGKTTRAADEILTGLQVPDPGPGSAGCYLKLGARKTLEISIVNLAAWVKLESDGTIAQARIFMGAVGPTPLRARETEAMLPGYKPVSGGEDDFAASAAKAASEATPIDDFRGSAEYRRAMVEVLARRALSTAYLAAREG